MAEIFDINDIDSLSKLAVCFWDDSYDGTSLIDDGWYFLYESELLENLGIEMYVNDGWTFEHIVVIPIATAQLDDFLNYRIGFSRFQDDLVDTTSYLSEYDDIEQMQNELVGMGTPEIITYALANKSLGSVNMDGQDIELFYVIND